MGLVEQTQKGGVGGPAFQIQTQGQIEGRAVPTGKAFEIPGAAAAAENSQDRHQQQEPLGVADAASHASIWDGAEKTDQVGRLITCCGKGFWHGKDPFQATEPNPRSRGKGDSEKLLGSLGPTLQISGGEKPIEFTKQLCSRPLDLDVGLPLSQQPSSALIKVTLASPVLVVFSIRIEPSPAKTSLPFSPASTKTIEIL